MTASPQGEALNSTLKKDGILMKKIVFIIIIILMIILVSPAVSEYFNTESYDGNEVTVEIKEGATIDEIADILKDNGLIKYKTVFKLKTRLSEYANTLRYGTFILSDGMCLQDILKELATGGMVENTVKFIVPEGFSVENIAQRAENLGLCTKDEFLDALNERYDYAFISKIPTLDYKYKLQGFLFPSTYEFYKDAKPYDIINTMLGEFEKQYNSVSTNYDNIYENIIKASLIEREALLDSEKTIISGVIKNRLEANMLLQIDASVAYAVTDGVYDITSVTYQHLKTNSLYNTYRYKGLPVGPIANPGLEAIKAALSPQNNNYYYYHTDTDKGDGSHIFSENYQQHLNTMN